MTSPSRCRNSAFGRLGCVTSEPLNPFILVTGFGCGASARCPLLLSSHIPPNATHRTGTFPFHIAALIVTFLWLFHCLPTCLSLQPPSSIQLISPTSVSLFFSRSPARSSAPLSTSFVLLLHCLLVRSCAHHCNSFPSSLFALSRTAPSCLNPLFLVHRVGAAPSVLSLEAIPTRRRPLHPRGFHFNLCISPSSPAPKPESSLQHCLSSLLLGAPELQHPAKGNTSFSKLVNG